MLNPFDEASFLALPPDLQDFVAHLHASEGKDLDGAAGLLGVSVDAAREVLARKDVAAAIEDLSIRVAGAKAAPPPRDQRSGWQKERDAKFARPGATDGQRAWNEKGGRPPSLDPAKFRDALLAGGTLGEAAAQAGSRAAGKKDLGTIGSVYLAQRPELRAELVAAGWDPKAAWRRRMAARAASRVEGAPPTAPEPKEKPGRPQKLDLAALEEALLGGKTYADAARLAGSRQRDPDELGRTVRRLLRSRPDLVKRLVARGWALPNPGRRPEPTAPSRAPAAAPPKERAEPPTTIEVSLHPRAVEVLDRALATGLFGRSRSEAAERLLCLALADGIPRWRRAEVTP